MEGFRPKGLVGGPPFLWPSLPVGNTFIRQSTCMVDILGLSGLVFFHSEFFKVKVIRAKVHLSCWKDVALNILKTISNGDVGRSSAKQDNGETYYGETNSDSGTTSAGEKRWVMTYLCMERKSMCKRRSDLCEPSSNLTLFLPPSGMPIQCSRVAMLRGRTAAKCGSCGRWWGKQIKNGK